MKKLMGMMIAAMSLIASSAYATSLEVTLDLTKPIVKQEYRHNQTNQRNSFYGVKALVLTRHSSSSSKSFSNIDLYLVDVKGAGDLANCLKEVALNKANFAKVHLSFNLPDTAIVSVAPQRLDIVFLNEEVTGLLCTTTTK